MNLFTKAALGLSLASVVAFAQPFELDASHSEVGFSVKHMMISNTKGKFNDYSTMVDFDIKTNTFKALFAKIKVASISTENEKRDAHLTSADFFDAAKFPEMTFKMTSYEQDKDDKNEGVVKGDLTIKGVTKPVSLDVEIGGVAKGFQGETRLGFELSGKINRKDFGLSWNKTLETGGLVVGEDVKLKIELEATSK